jgi:hypothetical protein
MARAALVPLPYTHTPYTPTWARVRPESLRMARGSPCTPPLYPHPLYPHLGEGPARVPEDGEGQPWYPSLVPPPLIPPTWARVRPESLRMARGSPCTPPLYPHPLYPHLGEGPARVPEDGEGQPLYPSIVPPPLIPPPGRGSGPSP